MILTLLAALACLYALGLVVGGIMLFAVRKSDSSGDASLGIGAMSVFWPYVLATWLKAQILEAWKFSAESADGKHLRPTEFRALLNDALDHHRLTEKEILREFGCSVPTLARWRSGENSPHPALRRAVIDYVQSRRSGLRP